MEKAFRPPFWLPPSVKVDSEQAFGKMLDEILKNEDIIGFDCERDSNFFNPRTALIQISTKSNDFLLFSNRIDRTVVSLLNEITHNPTILKVRQCLLYTMYDKMLFFLREEYALEFCNVFDMEAASELLQLSKRKYSFLLQEFLKINASQLTEDFQRHDWSLKPDDPGALFYSQLGTPYLIAIHQHLLDKIKDDNLTILIKEESCSGCSQNECNVRGTAEVSTMKRIEDERDSTVNVERGSECIRDTLSRHRSSSSAPSEKYLALSAFENECHARGTTEVPTMKRGESDCRNSRERVPVNVCQPVKQDVFENNANLLRRKEKKEDKL
ncbi:unnamed protein product [Didymodactylos carnosus]|uniref:3'-5' exonuclease domain-containing protein n=1 Tax=Didymodactylos carnosus TaxID=1234261 RepID=A0A8S2FDH2_9BILA|nr:unnamed protein product [Didymodactylos carnosus]CAF4232163.1 unnamed protein product [Didymodactylos carnosus]